MNGHQHTQSICLVILAVGAIGVGLYYLQAVLLPFVIAFFLVVGCRPIAEYFEKRLHLHHLLAFALTFVCGISVLAFFAILTFVSIQDLARNQQAYESRLNSIAKWLDERIPEEAMESEEAVESGGSDETSNRAEELSMEQQDINAGADPDAKSREAVEHMLSQGTEYMKSIFLSLAGSLTSLLSYAVLIMIYVFFLLLGNDGMANQPELIIQIESKVRQYLVVKTIISAVTGLVFGLILWLFGVPLAIVFGLLAFLLNFIPNIGPLISTLIPVPFLVLNSEMNTTAALTCFVLIAVVQFLSGNVVETRIMGKAFDVNPIVLLLSLMFFGQIWGIVGMFLATPIVSMIKIVLDQRESTKGFGDLLAGRLDLLANGKT